MLRNSHQYCVCIARTVNRLIDVAGDKPLTEYVTGDIRAMQDSLLAAGLSPRTANAAVSMLRPMFYQALTDGIILRNPAARLRKIPETASPRRAFPLATLRQITALATPPYDAILTLSYQSGLRTGELFNIQIADIHGATLIVPRSKTGKPRQVPLTDEARAAVAALRGQRETGPLITTHAQPTSFRAHLAANLRAAWWRLHHDGAEPPSHQRFWLQKNVPEITTQDLRHSFVSILRECGVDSEMRARLAGHTAAVDERIYTHIAPHSLTEAMQAFQSGDPAATALAQIIAQAMAALPAGEPITPQALAALIDRLTKGTAQLAESLR